MNKYLILFFVILTTNLYAQMPNKLSNTDKIYGLSKFWQEVNYNFIYLDKIDKEKWNNQYKKLLADIQKTKDDYEYYLLLQKFCASLNDGHTNIYFPKEIQDKIQYSDFGEYKIYVSSIDDKVIITRINSSKKRELPIGTEIIEVNGLSARKYIEKNIHPYISSSTEYIRKDKSTKRIFQAPEGTTFQIKVRFPNGKERSLKITHQLTKDEKLYPSRSKNELLDFKWIEKDIAYLSLNSFSDPKIESLFIEKLPELYKAKKLIIDLRNNGGGNTGIGLNIFKYLTNDTILYGSKAQSRLHIPTFKAWGKWTEAKDTIGNEWAKKEYLSYRDEYYYNFPYKPDTIQLKTKRIVVPTVLLIGNSTASAAEDFLIYADNQKHITKIGEPTFGSTGQPMVFDLPGGGTARICTKKDTYPDGREFVGVGIQPDTRIKKSLDDYLENKDPALEKAIEFLTNYKK